MAARSPLFVIFLTVFLDLLGFGMIIPVSAYYAQHYHATDAQIPLLGAMYSIAQFLFMPFWGRLSDRIGRRPVMLASVLSSVFSMAIFGAAASLPWLFFARFFAGATTANIGTAQAYISDVTTPENRAKGMGIIGMAFGLGFILGPFIGGELSAFAKAHNMGYGLLGYVSSGLAAINFIAAFFLLPESLPKEKRNLSVRVPLLTQARDAFTTPGLNVVFLVFAVTTFAFVNMESTFALLTMHHLGWTDANDGARSNGHVFALIGVISAITQGGLIGPLVKRFGESRVLVTGLALLACGLGGLGFITSVATLVISTIFISIGNSLVSPSIYALVSKFAPHTRVGGVIGVQQSLGALMRVLGPLGAGLLIRTEGNDVVWPLWLAGMLTGTSMLFALSLLRAAKPESTAAA